MRKILVKGETVFAMSWLYVDVDVKELQRVDFKV